MPRLKSAISICLLCPVMWFGVPQPGFSAAVSPIAPAADPAQAQATDQDIARLISQLSSTDPEERNTARIKLISFGSAARPQLWQATFSPSPEMRLAATELLLAMNWNQPGESRVVSALLQLYGSKPQQERLTLSRQIFQLAFGAFPAERRSRRSILSEDPKLIRSSALAALYRILQFDPSPAVRWSIAESLILRGHRVLPAGFSLPAQAPSTQPVHPSKALTQEILTYNPPLAYVLTLSSSDAAQSIHQLEGLLLQLSETHPPPPNVLYTYMLNRVAEFHLAEGKADVALARLGSFWQSRAKLGVFNEAPAQNDSAETDDDLSNSIQTDAMLFLSLSARYEPTPLFLGRWMSLALTQPSKGSIPAGLAPISMSLWAHHFESRYRPILAWGLRQMTEGYLQALGKMEPELAFYLAYDEAVVLFQFHLHSDAYERYGHALRAAARLDRPVGGYHIMQAVVSAEELNFSRALDHLDQAMQDEFYIRHINSVEGDQPSALMSRITLIRLRAALHSQDLAALRKLTEPYSTPPLPPAPPPAPGNPAAVQANTAQSPKLSDAQKDLATELVLAFDLLNEPEISQGWYEAAKAAYQDDLTNSPDNPVHLNSLAWLCGRTGKDVPLALTLAARAHELDPSSAAIADTYAEALHRTGRHTEAVSLAHRALRTRPNDAFMLSQLKRFEEAAKSIPHQKQ